VLDKDSEIDRVVKRNKIKNKNLIGGVVRNSQLVPMINPSLPWLAELEWL
jgi:hypothetical protein